MLKQRVITALVMLAILLPALFYRSAVPFSALALLLIAAGAWEWARLNGDGPGRALLAGLACVVLCGMSWYLGLLDRPLPLLWRLAGAAWVLAGAWLLRGGVAGWSRIPRTLRLVGGVLALWLAWLAVAQARIIGIE
ncbi:MAG: phosphatidate cytidylyltransferase, partial [Burkholderiales bacterium]|nr:phosphatidate cytidylyltransferase [Burkholderiales bacterium]